LLHSEASFSFSPQFLLPFSTYFHFLVVFVYYENESVNKQKNRAMESEGAPMTNRNIGGKRECQRKYNKLLYTPIRCAIQVDRHS